MDLECYFGIFEMAVVSKGIHANATIKVSSAARNCLCKACSESSFSTMDSVCCVGLWTNVNEKQDRM